MSIELTTIPASSAKEPFRSAVISGNGINGLPETSCWSDVLAKNEASVIFGGVRVPAITNPIMIWASAFASKFTLTVSSPSVHGIDWLKTLKDVSILTGNVVFSLKVVPSSVPFDASFIARK